MEASPLPLDPLLEIFARSDPATVARCGATCKFLRRHVTDPAFLRRLRVASSDRFLLRLLYHRSHSSWDGEEGTRPRPLFAAPKSSAGSPMPKAVIARLSAELAGPYEPIASRGGLLVLRLGKYYPTDLCVCNLVAGRSYVLPPKGIADHLHVVMPEDEGDGLGDMSFSFKMLVADRGLRTQTYSSKAGVWGPVTDATEYLPGHYELVHPSQVVLGGVARWLYRQGLTRLYSVLALDVGTGQAAWIEVPRDCHRRRRKVTTREIPQELLLVSSADGKLALLVWERPLAVCMWTVSDPVCMWPFRAL